MRGVGVYQAAPRSRSRGSSPSAALGRHVDGAPAPRERLAADGRLLRGWGDIGDRAPLRVSAYAVNDEPRGALFSTVPY